MGIQPWGAPHFLPENLDMPANTKTPSRVFVAPMSDMGHLRAETHWLMAIVDAMKAAPWHSYIVLTKRPGRWMADLPRGVWAGVTAENQARFDERWPILVQSMMDVHPRVLFVSVEPMLEPVSIIRSPAIDHPCQMPDWVLCGPETGSGARPCEHGWIEGLAAESDCFFDKREPMDGTRREWPCVKAERKKGGEE
jgi:protein gp37